MYWMSRKICSLEPFPTACVLVFPMCKTTCPDPFPPLKLRNPNPRWTPSGRMSRNHGTTLGPFPIVFFRRRLGLDPAILYYRIMRQYIRSRSAQVFFFTLVTHERREILTTDLGRSALRTAIQTVRAEHPFRITAVVLLPDHLHAVWELPAGDMDYSSRWRLIKSFFTRLWIEQGGEEGFVERSRTRKGERAVWQRRFYEHTCRDDDDLKRCVDYVHVNPLKHRLVDRVIDWPWSSFHHYVRLGEYSSKWGSCDAWYGDEFKHAE